MNGHLLSLIYQLIEAADDAATFLARFTDFDDDPETTQPVPNKALELKTRLEDIVQRLWNLLGKETAQ